MKKFGELEQELLKRFQAQQETKIGCIGTSNFRMLRPRLNQTKTLGGCPDRDSSRLKNMDDVETETNRYSSNGVEIKKKSLAYHWLANLHKITTGQLTSMRQLVVSLILQDIYSFDKGWVTKKNVLESGKSPKRGGDQKVWNPDFSQM